MSFGQIPSFSKIFSESPTVQKHKNLFSIIPHPPHAHHLETLSKQLTRTIVTFPSLRNHFPLLPNVQCFENRCFVPDEKVNLIPATPSWEEAKVSCCFMLPCLCPCSSLFGIRFTITHTCTHKNPLLIPSPKFTSFFQVSIKSLNSCVRFS